MPSHDAKIPEFPADDSPGIFPGFSEKIGLGPALEHYQSVWNSPNSKKPRPVGQRKTSELAPSKQKQSTPESNNLTSPTEATIEDRLAIFLDDNDQLAPASKPTKQVKEKPSGGIGIPPEDRRCVSKLWKAFCDGNRRLVFTVTRVTDSIRSAKLTTGTGPYLSPKHSLGSDLIFGLRHR
jgi:hypothetical protein